MTSPNRMLYAYLYYYLQFKFTVICTIHRKNKLGCVYLDFEETKNVEKEEETKREEKVLRH